MNIFLKTKSDVPIYEQIEEQIKVQILNNELLEDDQLPSIRQLARDLKISIITTTRAYNDLQNEGYISSVAGKGFFVAPKNNNLLRERFISQMENSLENAVESGKNAGLKKTEIISALKNCMEGK